MGPKARFRPACQLAGLPTSRINFRPVNSIVADPPAGHAGYTCPLCEGKSSAVFHADAGRLFLKCPECTLIFVDPADRLRPLEETLRYLHHQNHGDDPAYVQFLERLMVPVCDAVPEGSRGLDFGCGPTPVMAELLTTRGRPTSSYDPLFFADKSRLLEKFNEETMRWIADRFEWNLRLSPNVAIFHTA